MNCQHDGSEYFEISGDRLVLKQALDFESDPYLSVYISVTDNGSPPLSSKKKLEFHVTNVEELPSSISIEPVRGRQAILFPKNEPAIKENALPGAYVGQLVVYDPDRGESLTVVISGKTLIADHPGCLTLTKGTRCSASIILDETLNYEEKENFTITVSATDSTGGQLERNFLVRIQDENDSPEKILFNNMDTEVLRVKENSANMTIATLQAIDPDAEQAFTYTVKGNPQFYVSGNDLRVTSTANLDHEGRNEIYLTIKAYDSGMPSLSIVKDVTVQVEDVNEPPAAIALTRNKFPEDSKVGTEIGSFITRDPDDFNTIGHFTYKLIDEKTPFMINGADIQVGKSEFNYEEKQMYEVKVQVTDDGVPPLSTVFTVVLEVTDINDAPENLQLSGDVISEDAGVNTVLGMLSADDADDDAIHFTIPDSNIFSVDGKEIIVNGVLDYETSPLLEVKVVATDSGLPQKSVLKVFTIKVTDANDVPNRMDFIPTSGKFELSEYAAINRIVGELRAYDPDMTDHITYKMDKTSSKYLKLSTATPVCRHEKIPSSKSTVTMCATNVILAKSLTNHFNPLVLKVVALDKGNLTYTGKWTIDVLDVNDAPTDIIIKGRRLEIPENTRAFKLGVLECMDHDHSQKHIFQILKHWDIFKVTEDDVLYAEKRFDAETEREYELTIRCIDDGVPPGSFSKTFSIQIVDTNEKPTMIALSNNEIPMTAKVGDTVAIIDVEDPDNMGKDPMKQQHNCSLIQDQSGVFSLNQDENVLQLREPLPLDLESTMITIKCSDNGEPTYSTSKGFTLVITETADVPKKAVFIGSGTTLENRKDVEIGAFFIMNMLTETRIPGDFVFGNLTVTETNENLLSIVGNKLVSSGDINFEKHPKLSGTVTATGTDMKNKSINVDGSFEIIVIDVNESPQHITINGGGIIDENALPGTIIGNLQTLDQDWNQNHTYEIISVVNGLNASENLPQVQNAFFLDGSTLRVGKNHKAFDFEKFQLYSLKVQSIDSGEPPLSLNSTIQIIVEDTNDAPTNISLSFDQISEMAQVGQLIGRIEVEDQDKGQNHRCVINNLNDVPFKVENSLDLKVSNSILDYESVRTYIVEITCQDTGEDGSHLKFRKALPVFVEDVNEPPYNITLSNLHILEENAAGSLVGKLSATDPDSRNITFFIGGDKRDFEIKGDNTLVTLRKFNFENETDLTVTIKAKDEQGLFSTKEFSIEIADKNEKPISVSLSKAEVPENSKPGTLVGYFETVDPDQGQKFTYTLNETSVNKDFFDVVENMLVVGEHILNHEEMDPVRILMMSKDNGNPSLFLTVHFDIEIKNANDPPTEIVIQEPVSVKENVEINHVIANVTIIDEDVYQDHHCSVLTPTVPFTMASVNGKIHLVAADLINYEEAAEYDIKIKCSDGEFDIVRPVHIEIKDMNEKPIDITLDGSFFLPAVIEHDFQVGSLIATDEDLNQTYSYSVTGPNSELFKVDGNHLVLVHSIPEDVLDHSPPEVKLMITVYDNGQIPQAYSHQVEWRFQVTNLDRNAFDVPDIVLNKKEIAEDAIKGDVVARIQPINGTVSDSIVFSIAKDSSSLFQLKNNRELVLARNVSTVSEHSVSLTIQAKRSSTQTVEEKTFVIFILRSDKCFHKGVTCDDDAKCIQVNGTHHECQCNEDFYGNGYKCSKIDDCSTEGAPKCKFGGRCVDDINSFACYCKNDYAGDYCEVLPQSMDPCANNICQNEAVCKAFANSSYACICKPGWLGQNCSTSVDECKGENQPCSGNGVCIDGHLTFSCNCLHNTTGSQCQFLQASCNGVFCDNNTVCVPKQIQDDHVCVSEQNAVDIEIHCNTMNTKQQCLNGFFLFVERQGGFLQQTSMATREKRHAVHFIERNSHDLHADHRNRRTSQDSKQSHGGVMLWPSSVREGPNSTILVTFYALSRSHVPYSTEEVLKRLHTTCYSIASSELEESKYCPGILTSYNQFRKTNVTLPPTTSSADQHHPTSVIQPGKRKVESGSKASRESSQFAVIILSIIITNLRL